MWPTGTVVGGVRAVGFVGGVTFAGLLGIWFDRTTTPVRMYVLIGLLVAPIFCAVAMVLGVGLSGLQRWVLAPTCVAAVLCMPVFPAGTLLGLYVLWLIRHRYNAVVFSPEYEQIRLQTPHIKQSGVRLVIGLLLLSLALGLVAPSALLTLAWMLSWFV